MSGNRPVAIVTGAAGGIGRAVVDRLVADGYDVVATDLSRPPAGEHVLAQAADLVEVGSAAGLVESAVAAFGRLDAVVSNAAIISQVEIAGHTRELWDRTFAVNTRAPFELMQAALPRMSAGATVVCVVSLAAFQFTGAHLAYTASKSALLGLVRDAACEVANRGIRVVGVAPGPTRTKMFDDIPEERIAAIEAAAPLPGVNDPGDVAGTIAFLLSPAARRITGIVLPVTGGAELTIVPGRPAAR